MKAPVARTMSTRSIPNRAGSSVKADMARVPSNPAKSGAM